MFTIFTSLNINCSLISWSILPVVLSSVLNVKGIVVGTTVVVEMHG